VTAAGIAVRGLTKRFGPAVALDGVDLEIASGHSLVVLGPNGAGKSTLLRLMAGLTRPTAGDLTIAGAPAERSEARSRVGYIGHATLLYPVLTARENLLFAARLHRVGNALERVESLLADEGLSGAADRPVGGFSRGMAQRVAIARGLVHDPAVVLLDEPFTGLDRRAAERLAERLNGLRHEERTIVLVTHDVVGAAGLADSAVVLARGRVVSEFAAPPDADALEQAYVDATDAVA